MTEVHDNFVYLSKDGKEQFGERTELQLSDWLELVHSADIVFVRTQLGNAKTTRSEYQLEYRIVDDNDSVRRMLHIGAPRFSSAGEFVGYTGTMLDVTELHESNEQQTSEQFQDREERFHRLTLLSSDWYWETDEEGRFTFISDGLRRIESAAGTQLLGKRRDELAYDRDHPALLDYLQALAERAPFRNLTISFRNTSGHYFHAMISGEPVYEQGRFKGYQGIGLDVTETHHATQQLSTILESIGDAFFSVDKNWTLTYVNHKTEEFARIDATTAIGKPIWEVVPEIVDSTVFAHYQHAMQSGQITFFEEYYEPQHAWVDVRVYPHETGLSVFFTDITARYEAERIIRESELRFREMIEITPAGYFSTDANGVVIEVNPALGELTGYENQEILGRGMEVFLRPGALDEAQKSKNGTTAVHGEETLIRHKRGYHVYVLINYSIKRNVGGNTISLTAFVTDITEPK